MIKRNSTKTLPYAAAFVLIFLSCVFGKIIIKYEISYTQATALMKAGNYSEALNKLNSISNDKYKNSYLIKKLCKDTYLMKDLCLAHTLYDSGKFEEALNVLSDFDVCYDLNEENRKETDAIKAAAETKYAEQKQKEEEERQEKERKERQEYIEKVTKGVPFVGMSEADIDKTTLGSPSPKTRGNTEYIRGKSYKATLYDFMQGEYVIFTARCIQGKVTQVFDSRDNPHKPYGSQSSSKSRNSSKKTIPDDANDYDDPDEFYEENRDCFTDYYEAEDYWYDETEE